MFGTTVLGTNKRLEYSFDLPQSVLTTWVVPKNAVVYVFHNAVFLSGNLLIDNGTFSIDPWKTAMKRADQMRVNGWDLTQIENHRNYYDRTFKKYTTVVMIYLEKR